MERKPGQKTCPACGTPAEKRTKICPECGHQYYGEDIVNNLNKGFNKVSSDIKAGFTVLGKDLKDGLKEGVKEGVNEVSKHTVKHTEEIVKISEKVAEAVEEIKEVKIDTDTFGDTFSSGRDEEEISNQELKFSGGIVDKVKNLVNFFTKDVFYKRDNQFRKIYTTMTKQLSITLDLLKENLPSLREASEKNPTVNRLVEYLEDEGNFEFLEKIYNELKEGKKISGDNFKIYHEKLNNVLRILDDTDSLLDVKLSWATKQISDVVKNGGVGLEQTKNMVKSILKILDESVKQNKLNKKQIESLNNIKSIFNENIELDETTRETLGNALDDISNKLSDGDIKTRQTIKDTLKLYKPLFKSNEDFKRVLNQVVDTNKTLQRYLEESGLDETIRTIKGGAAELLLAQIGLGGMGIGEFLTDAKRRKAAINAFREFAKSSFSIFEKIKGKFSGKTKPPKVEEKKPIVPSKKVEEPPQTVEEEPIVVREKAKKPVKVKEKKPSISEKVVKKPVKVKEKKPSISEKVVKKPIKTDKFKKKKEKSVPLKKKKVSINKNVIEKGVIKNWDNRSNKLFSSLSKSFKGSFLSPLNKFFTKKFLPLGKGFDKFIKSLSSLKNLGGSLSSLGGLGGLSGLFGVLVKLLPFILKIATIVVAFWGATKLGTKLGELTYENAPEFLKFGEKHEKSKRIKSLEDTISFYEGKKAKAEAKDSKEDVEYYDNRIKELKEELDEIKSSKRLKPVSLKKYKEAEPTTIEPMVKSPVVKKPEITKDVKSAKKVVPEPIPLAPVAVEPEPPVKAVPPVASKRSPTIDVKAQSLSKVSKILRIDDVGLNLIAYTTILEA